MGKYVASRVAARRRGVIYTIAPSYQDIQRIWVGTDDGLIHVTADGGTTWKDVTPPQVTSWAKVSLIDAGRFNPATAYAAINTLRLDDLRPHILGTHDGGATWTEIVSGIPAGETVNAVREDPKKKGLLFAATERAVYVSFDDGLRWQALRQNMPVSSVRDIIVKDDDLVAATHGRGSGSWMTSRRSGRWALRRATRTRCCSSPPRAGASAGTRAPTCRGRSKSPREPIRPTAFPSTTT